MPQSIRRRGNPHEQRGQLEGFFITPLNTLCFRLRAREAIWSFAQKEFGISPLYEGFDR